MTRFGPFIFDAGCREVRAGDGRPVHLTRKAFDLLAVLLDASPRVVPKSELHERLWPATYVSDAALASLVKELRRALPGGRDGPLIKTTHGVGYSVPETVAVGHRDAGEQPARQWIITADRRIALRRGMNAIGREPSAEICLDAAGVSRRHARIVVTDQVAELEDLGSKNGTTMHGRRVTGRVRLRDGDAFRIGPVAVIYRAESGLSTATAADDPGA